MNNILYTTRKVMLEKCTPQSFIRLLRTPFGTYNGGKLHGKVRYKRVIGTMPPSFCVFKKNLNGFLFVWCSFEV